MIPNGHSHVRVVAPPPPSPDLLVDALILDQTARADPTSRFSVVAGTAKGKQWLNLPEHPWYNPQEFDGIKGPARQVLVLMRQAVDAGLEVGIVLEIPIRPDEPAGEGDGGDGGEGSE